MTSHIIFDVNIYSGIKQKDRFVPYGHKVNTPPSTTYVSVVSIYSIRVVIILAALNDIDVECINVQNTYLN